jgi:hypothetical protein
MRYIYVTLLAFLAIGCTEQDTKQSKSKSTTAKTYNHPKRVDVTYTLQSMKDSNGKTLRSRYTEQQLYTIYALNRMDKQHGAKADSLIIPNEIHDDFVLYSPFPYVLESLKDVEKMVFFSYPSQAFAAYEHGHLVHWGPTNMGRKADPTPTGLYFANWKAEETVSTVDDEWILKWNFNIENLEGIGWHEYAMPGYPASHSCLRMLQADAKYMYEWADQWVLKGTDNKLANGTPVIVFGNYNFDGPKPWWALAQNPKALDISEAELNGLVQQHLSKILKEQEQRNKVKPTEGS